MASSGPDLSEGELLDGDGDHAEDRERRYILVAVKLPEPVQPELIPVSVQVPVMVLFFTLPCRFKVLPLGFPDLIMSWKVPMTLPSKFPPRTKAAVSVSSETKQGVWVVKLRFVTLTELPLICVKLVVKAKA